jgi:transcription initiation factor IIE alpha subunit
MKGVSMEKMKTVYLEEIKNPKEKEVLKLLNDKGKCLYGNIFKELSISSTEGQHIIFSLLSRGLIKYQYHSSNIELNVRLQ